MITHMSTENPLLDLIAQQPAATLIEWRRSLVEQIKDREMQVRIIDQVLESSRKSSSAVATTGGATADTAAGGSPGRKGDYPGIKRDEVIDVVRTFGGPITYKQLTEQFILRGKEVRPEAMRAALNRITDKGIINKIDARTFIHPENVPVTENGGGESLFRTPAPQSQELAAANS